MSTQYPGTMDQADVAGAGHTLPAELPSDPFGVFVSWFDLAHAKSVQPNPNAFTLATVEYRSGIARPTARVVLCKGMDAQAGRIVFYTNYRGRKARAIESSGYGAAVFHWDVLDKQVRMEGPIEKSPSEESDAYFASRPWLSRIGAWASDQGEPIADRAALKAKLDATFRRFGIDPANLPPKDAMVEIPRPAHWGGFRLTVERLELWCAGEGRLHDRAVFTRELVRQGATWAGGPWTGTRLQP